ncbi:MAG: DegT/DnrJ/EryC1/StrS family aminotransferase [Nanoarchaeota archaeon]
MKTLKKHLDKIQISDLLRGIYIKYNRTKRVMYHDFRYIHYKIRNKLTHELNHVLNLATEYELWNYVNKFEREFANLCGTRYATSTSSGTAALQFSLLAFGAGKGHEVITVGNSYIATALSISNTGAKPVFIDINPYNYNIDVNKIEEKITDKTKAIIPVHLYGQSADLDSIKKVAKKHNLKVVEDACQACGGRYKNKQVGSFGDTGCFSFYTSKNLSGLGNGGMIVSNDRKIVEKIKQLKNPESDDESLIKSKRTPAYLDAIQAAFLKAKLPFLEKSLKLKRTNAMLYNEFLKDESIVLPNEENFADHSYYSYVIRTKKRDQLQKYLSRKGVETQIEYKTPIHLTRTFSYLGYKLGDLPNTEKISKEILSLPIGIHISTEDIAYICKNIKSFIRKHV